jgi:hypothetical protein
MADKHHWDYYQALEEDVARVRRFIDFSHENLKTFSIELARQLVAATQEVDVLFRQICAKCGGDAQSESGYREFFAMGDYVKIRDIQISVHGCGLKFTPFKDWVHDAPAWWTANNKIKHERHTHFQHATLENVLSAVSALLIANIYFANANGSLKNDLVPSKLLLPRKLIKAAKPGFSALKLKMP